MLVNAAIYHTQKSPTKIDLDNLNKFELNHDDFFWGAFQNPTKDEISPLFQHLKIHELAIEDIEHGNQISKIEEYDDHLFVVLKQIQLVNDDVEIGDVYIVASEKFIITIRKGVGNGFTHVRKTVEKKSTNLTLGTGFVMYSILDTVIDRYFPIINQLEIEFENLEKEIFDETHNDKSKVMKKLYEFKTKTRIIKNHILPLSDSIHKLFGGRVPEICENLDKYFRDTHDHLTRISASLDSLLESVNSSLQVAVAMITIEESKITKKLASWAAIFASITLLAGIWGMNFKHMPELDFEYGYPLALLTMLMTSSYMFYRFKKSNWL